MRINWVAPVNPCHPYLENAPAPPFAPHYLRISPWLWFSITTTLPQFGRFLAGNRFAEGKATKLSSAWAGRYEEVFKVPIMPIVVVILAGS